MFEKLKRGLARSRASLGDGLRSLVGRDRRLDAADLERLEEALLGADVGLPVTERILEAVRSNTGDGDAGASMAREVRATLEPLEAPLSVERIDGRPFIILVAGVNGSGKTTTIGKLAARWRDEGLNVVLAAGDTFRAAAVEQLQAWGERVGVEVIAQGTGADPAAVIHDAITAGRSRGVDVVICDTAGRLQTQAGLMAEVAKVKRVMGKAAAGAPDEVLLVLDATAGQNALRQVEEFDRALGVTGLVLTKLDGTARGGVLLAIAGDRTLPVRFIGVGEGVDDLLPFKAADYAAALLDGAGAETDA